MRLRPIALPAAVAALALGGLAAPAQAAPDDAGPTVGVIVPEQIAVIEGKKKTVRAEVLNVGPATAKDVVLKLADVDPGLALTLPAGCDATSCQVGDLAAGARKVITFTVAVTGDKLLSAFEMSVGAFVTEVTVVRSEGGVDLEIEPIDDLKLGRGQSAALPITVHNTGTEAVDSVGLLILSEDGLSTLGDYRNCVSLSELGEGAEELGSGVICKFDEEFAPNSTFSVPEATPIKVRLAPDAGGPYTYTSAVMAIGVNDDDAAVLAKKKTGRVLTLDAVRRTSDITDGTAPEDINDEDNLATFGVAVGRSVADSAAVGGTFAGAAGDPTTIEVGLHNLGPTTLIPGTADFEWFPSVQVTVPTGVKLTEVDIDCVPGTGGVEWDFDSAGTVDGLDYTCFPEYGAGVDEKVTFAFTGTLTGDKSTAGSIVVDGGVQDSNAKNDKAAVTVALTGGGGQGGGLPITGAPTGWVVLGGAVLLLAGAVAAFVFRRRRIVTVL